MSQVAKKRIKASKAELPSRSDSPDDSEETRIVKKQKIVPTSGSGLVSYEDSLVDDRDPQKDLEIHNAICDEFMDILVKIEQIKSKQDNNAKAIDDLRVKGSLLTVCMKKLNRLAQLRSKKVKDATEQAKQKIDSFHLQLQNLLYEHLHMEKEVTKCYEFKSKDEDIELVSEQEFYSSAPDSICRPEETKQDPHKRHMARLDWELEQRKQLAEQCKLALAKKDDLNKDNKSKESYIDKLLPNVSAVLDVLSPLQETVGLPFNVLRKYEEASRLLPTPLYVMYIQMASYKESGNMKSFMISIQGDIEVAKTWEDPALQLDEESDSEGEDEGEEDNRLLVSRIQQKKEKIKKQQAVLLGRHPLSIVLQLKFGEQTTLQLDFYYSFHLNIVMVDTKLVTDNKTLSSISGSELLNSKTLLDGLFEDDYGLNSPNPATQYQLSKLGMNDYAEYVDSGKVFKPYRWTQWLAGLNFPKAEVDEMVSQSHMRIVMRAVRKRMTTRLTLQKQMSLFERGNIPVGQDTISMFPAKLHAQLVSWKSLRYDDYIALPFTSEVVGLNLADVTDMFYVALITRGSAKLKAAILVPADYPESAPIFSVALIWGKERTAMTDDNVRAMEHEVNFYYSELRKGRSHDLLLTNQLQRLRMCFDVYLETDDVTGENKSPIEFPREKVAPRVVRGRTRHRPFRYDSQMGLFIHRKGNYAGKP